MHSATKYLNGHSDVTAGALAGPARADGSHPGRAQETGDGARPARRLCARPRPEDAGGAGRAAQRQRDGGRALAVERQARAPRSTTRGSKQHPDHALAAKQMRGFGGMVCVDLGGGYDRAARVLRPAADLQARRQPRRRRKPVQPAGADLTVGPLERGARAAPASPTAWRDCPWGWRTRKT